MKTHKLLLDDTFKENFLVLAIYSDEEDYRMAYLLNVFLKIHLKKSSSIIDLRKETEYCVFEYEDKTLYQNWFLINNHCFTQKKGTYKNELFAKNTTLFQQKSFYIKKFKKAHYLLKVEVDNPTVCITELLKKIRNIPQIYEVESLDLELLNNNELLMF